MSRAAVLALSAASLTACGGAQPASHTEQGSETRSTEQGSESNDPASTPSEEERHASPAPQPGPSPSMPPVAAYGGPPLEGPVAPTPSH